MGPARRRGRISRAATLVVLALLAALSPIETAGQVAGSPGVTRVQSDRFPGSAWLRYADVAEAGFSAEELADALDFGARRGAVAILVVSRGAVVASQGPIERRFPIHSIRKSLLSALYGVFGDEIDLDLTLAELGIDDEPSLSAQERQARVVDLISSRSGIYHAAAGEPAEMAAARPERGSHEPGSYWWYNNWDFNAAGTVFERLTGTSVLTAFAEHIAAPIGMQDYRASDAFYHLEADRSKHRSFAVRMSTRDLARFGLLFARGGRWGNTQVIPAPWVEASTASHSEIDLGSEYGTGYGYMWWVEGAWGFAARGFGGHALAVYADDDLVLVVRADTYHDRFVSNRSIERIFTRIRRAREGAPAANPTLEPLVAGDPDPLLAPPMAPEDLARYVGQVRLESGGLVEVGLADEGLTLDYGRGVFRLLQVGEGRFLTEDSRDPVVIELADGGTVRRILSEPVIYLEAAGAVQRGDVPRAVEWVQTAVDTFPESPDARYNLARALNGTGHRAEAMTQLETALALDPGHGAAATLLSSLRMRYYAPLAAALLGGGLLAGWVVWRRRIRACR